MIRFLRRYFLNKWVLGGLGIVLMAVFGLEQALTQMFTGGGPTVGRIHGARVTLVDEQRANGEVRVLSRFPGLGFTLDRVLQVGVDESEDDALDSPAIRWLMIQADAERLGLQASQTQVDALLAVMGITDEQLAELAAESRANVPALRGALARYVVMMDYVDLVSGVSLARDASGVVEAGTPQARRLALTTQALIAGQSGRIQEAMGFGMMAEGSTRLSEPVVATTAVAQQALVSGELVVIDAAGRVDDDAAADPALEAELFEA
ncbi:MAG: hypothetical protein AAF078_12575, partial [Planctomycetota bacterium]